MSEYQDVLTRLQAVEDELAIRNLVTQYGMAADCGDAATAAALHTADCIYEVAAPGSGREDGDRHEEESLILEGPEAIRDMLNGAEHRALLPNCAHTVGPLHVSLEGESASVTGYSRLYHSQGEDVRLVRLGFNRWRLRKEQDGWKIQRRFSCPIGSEAAQQLFEEDIQLSRGPK